MGYYLTKASGLVITLILVSLLAFFVFQILPGDPVDVILGIEADEFERQAMRERLNLDRPIVERYVDWLKGALTGDLGISLRYQMPVSELLFASVGTTASLAFLALLLTVLIGIPIGVLLARFSTKKKTIAFSMVTQLGLSIPSFCLGVFLINIFSVRLNLLPSIGYTPISEGIIPWLRSLILPSLSIAIGTSSVLIRYVKVSITKEMGKEYVRTARSKGAGDARIMYSHVLRNSLIPVITILGMIAADILGGSIIVENVFSLPGIGRLISVSINTRDLPLIQALVVYLAAIVVVINFLVDMVYSVIDPRIRRGS